MLDNNHNISEIPMFQTFHDCLKKQIFGKLLEEMQNV